jgi:hypothetical protein
MRVKVWFIVSLFVLFVGFTNAQFDPCSLETVLDSFETAALAENVEVWAQKYADSECASGVKRSVRLLAQSYVVFYADDVVDSIPTYYTGTGQGVTDYSGDLSVNLGFYDDVSIQFTVVEAGQLDGFQLIGTAQSVIAGNYYGDLSETANPELWDVIEGCEEENIVAWVDWLTGERISGTIIVNLLYVAVITEDGEMCVATYDSSTGGLKVVDWSLEVDNP